MCYTIKALRNLNPSLSQSGQEKTLRIMVFQTGLKIDSDTSASQPAFSIIKLEEGSGTLQP